MLEALLVIGGATLGAVLRTYLARREDRSVESKLKEIIGAQQETLSDLHARLAARSPAEYYAWTAPGPDTDPEPRGRTLVDDTGLIDVWEPADDRDET